MTQVTQRTERHDEDLVRVYLDEIGRHELLTKDDEARLAQDIDAGRDARAELDELGHIKRSERRKLEETAQRHELAVQVRGAPRATGTDANAIQLSREGVATGLVGIPNRYMHSPVEMVCLDDLENAARLLAAFCESVTSDTDWTP